MKTIRVAAVQVESLNGQGERNLANAEPFVQQAVEQGAELVLCPEFLAAGYVYDESIWRSGEPAGGLTERWLERMATTHEVIIGASYLEAENDHFYNTFSLFDAGGLLGRVRKQSLPAAEGWFFSPCPKPKVIETRLGRICVGICNDNQTAAFLREVLAQRPDLILMPHSAPTPVLPRRFRDLYIDALSQVPVRYASSLGIAVVMANKISHERGFTTLPFLPLVKLPWQFHGYSRICDSDGETLAYLEDAEGALVATVTLDPARKKSVPQPKGYWSFAPAQASMVTGEALRALASFGRWAYGRSERRVIAARAVSARKPPNTTEPPTTQPRRSP